MKILISRMEEREQVLLVTPERLRLVGGANLVQDSILILCALGSAVWTKERVEGAFLYL